MKPIYVRCNCGRSTHLHWSDILNRMEAEDPEWSIAHSYEGITLGWTCGRPGHKQVPLQNMRIQGDKI